MEKKLYFLPADDLWEDERLSDISDEQFKLRSEVYYDTIEDYVSDFNRDVCPDPHCYYCRYI